MAEFLWRLAAKILSKPAVVSFLTKRALKTPYHHLASADGQELYMARYWLFNPYDRESRLVKYRWLPSIRLHFIYREDQDRDLHDHPWNARTIILQGGYQEQRPGDAEMLEATLEKFRQQGVSEASLAVYRSGRISEYIDRRAGDTAPLKHGEYHRIDKIYGGCAVTLFITGKYRGPWGFLVDGVKVPWRTYIGLRDNEDLTSADVCPVSWTGSHKLGTHTVEEPDGSFVHRTCCILCDKDM